MAPPARRALTLIYFGRKPIVGPWGDGDAESGDVCEGRAGPVSVRQAIERKWGGTDRTLKRKGFHSADGTLNWAAAGAATAS
jgi:hypothetical protein